MNRHTPCSVVSTNKLLNEHFYIVKMLLFYSWQKLWTFKRSISTHYLRMIH